MSMRISVLERPVSHQPKHSNSLSTKDSCIQNYIGSRRSPRPDFYIRTQHISRKPKSPFRKYESCVTESFKTTKFFATQSTSSITTINNNETVYKPPILANKIPFNPALNINKNDYKIVNKFEDLVIACVDDKSPTLKPICYKNRYLVNRSDSNWFLANNSHSDFRYTPDNVEDIKNKDSIIKIEIVNNKPESNQVFSKKSLSPYKMEKKCSFCSNCKAKLESDKLISPALTPNSQRKVVHFNNENFSKDLHTNQLPLATPEHSNRSAIKTDQNDGLLNFNDVEINPETAEQFIDILVAEDVMLRKKIADGIVDEKIFKRLERLTELRQKYMKYKEEQKKQVSNENVKDESNSKSKVEEKEIENNGDNIEQTRPIQTQKSFLAKAKSVTSLSDPAFSNELKLHPLVKT